MSYRTKEALLIFVILMIPISLVYGALAWHEDQSRDDCTTRGGHYLANQSLCISRDGRIMP